MQLKLNEFFSRIKLSAALLFVMFVPLVVGPWLSYDVKSAFYSLSLTIKSVLIFVLPFIVFSFVAACLARLGTNAFVFSILLVIMVFISNIMAIFTGYAIGTSIIPLLSIPISINDLDNSGLEAMWVFDLPPLFSNTTALITGILTGTIVGLINKPTILEFFLKSGDLASWIIKHTFVPLLPLFILGFAFKLHADGILDQAISTYGPIVLLVVVSQHLYLFLYYYIAAAFSFPKCIQYISNVFPAWLTGLNTVSSAATLPVLIESTEKNLNHFMARTIVPATINIHTIGSAIGLTILSLVTIHTFNMPNPDLKTFAVFGFSYALAKFSVAAVPGGVILVVGPILQNLLGFSNEMVGLITAVYIIFDPFATAVNVSGNGVFAIAFSKIYQRIGLGNTKHQTVDHS